MFRDGDTPKVLVDNKYYRVDKVTADSIISAGTMCGLDVKAVIKGFHFEEMVPGDGMWYKNSVKYAYSVEEA